MLSVCVWAKDSLPPVVDGQVPQSVGELWAGYDPRAEALDVTVIREWDETYQGQALKIQMLSFTVGTFKGEVSRISAYYAYPADTNGKVPGLVQVHGGGQRAEKNTVKADAANGYASISLNWGGRELADQKPGDPGTDWGAIDPTQKHVSHYFRLTPDDRTAETVYSPRNNNWFTLALATRRGLTFLEQQAVVDADRLGVYGHSMGGTITGQVAGLDPRIKAAVPSCGGAGISQTKNIARPGGSVDRRVGDKLYSKTIDSTASLRNLRYPILGQSPQNDFNCIYDDLNHNWQVIPDHSLVHFSISPHLNHRHVADSAFTRLRFFDAFLKGEDAFPARPELAVNLKTASGIPVAMVTPDSVKQVQGVQVYYSINPHSLTRFWRRAETVRDGDHWKAQLPIMSTAMPLFVMANVEYPQPRPLIGPPHLPESPSTFLVSSWETVFDPPALKAAGVKETDRPERMIQESFDDWQDWFRIGWPNTHHAQSGTRKLTDPKWRGPDGASLAIDVKDPKGGNFLMTFSVNSWGAYSGLKAGSYYCEKPLAKTKDWQTVSIALSDLKPSKANIPGRPTSWQGITELGIVAGIHRLPGATKTILSGGTWPGTRELRNLSWTGGAYTAPILYPGGSLSIEEFQKIFQDDIDKSIDLEDKDAVQSGASRGKALYAQICFNCHGPALEGGIGPALADSYWRHGSSAAAVLETINKGIHGTEMVGYEAAFPEADRRALRDFLLSEQEGLRELLRRTYPRGHFTDKPLTLERCDSVESLSEKALPENVLYYAHRNDDTLRGTAKLYLKKSATYRFGIRSNGRAAVFLDGKQVYYFDKAGNAETQLDEALELRAGTYDFELLHEHAQGFHAELQRADGHRIPLTGKSLEGSPPRFVRAAPLAKVARNRIRGLPPRTLLCILPNRVIVAYSAVSGKILKAWHSAEIDQTPAVSERSITHFAINGTPIADANRSIPNPRFLQLLHYQSEGDSVHITSMVNDERMTVTIAPQGPDSFTFSINQAPIQ